MQILEQQDLFELYQHQALTFDQWIQTIKDNKKLTIIQQHLENSQFIKVEAAQQLANLEYKTYLLAIVADWCGDCQVNVPILSHIAEASSHVELKLIIKENHLELLHHTNGGQKIPFVQFYSTDGYHLGTWIERPAEAYKMLAELYKEWGYESGPKLYEEVRKRFVERKNELYTATMNEVIAIILKGDAIQQTSFRLNKNE